MKVILRRLKMSNGISAAILGVIIFLVVAKKTNMIKK
jgi:hypothetical protein